MTTPDDPETLLHRALARVSSGEFAAAAALIEEAAELQARAGDTTDQARSLQLAASLRRAAGDTTSSRILAQRAAGILPDHLPWAVASLAEQAEAAAAEGRYSDAIDRFGASIDKARAFGLPPDAQFALLRRRGACLIACGAYREAEDDFDTACQLASPRIAAFLRAEQARLLLDAGEVEAAERVLPTPPSATAAPGLSGAERTDMSSSQSPHSNPSDAQLRAEIGVQRARLSRAEDDVEGARDHAATARGAALEAVAPVTYFAASVELSEALDELGQRGEAYAVLATAWGTLSNLLGRDIARSWLEPGLLALRLRWGEAEFNAVKQAHDARLASVTSPSPSSSHKPS